MLYRAGAIRRQGRVDHGDAHLDTDAMERERGITIFSKQTALDYAGAHLMLLDAPGHVDFSAEAERTLRALDYAILVVGANDGVQGHTETLWDLLERYGVPVFVFVNKTDLVSDGAAGMLEDLKAHLSAGCLDGSALACAAKGAGVDTCGQAVAAVIEDAAATEEDALEEYLASDGLAPSTIRRLVAERRIFRTPDWYGYFTATYTPVKPLNIALSGTYTGSMLVQHMKGYIAKDVAVTTPDFFDMTAKVSYDFSLYKAITLQVNAGVQNIFNAYQRDFDQGKERDSGYIYGPSMPRSYFAGMKLMF